MINKTLRSEIRKAYFLNKYVIITPTRSLRPQDYKAADSSIIDDTTKCPFCPPNINHKNVITPKNNKNWQVLALNNIFPAVTLDNKKAYGRQEVIIETPNHEETLADLTEEHIEKILRMHAHRTEEINRNPKINYILCFKNQGLNAGASLQHAHSQIFASEFIPPTIREELTLGKIYRKQNKSCGYCDVIKKEIKSKRKVYSDKYAVAFTPYASQYNYEIWIFTKRHLDNITRLNDHEFRSFAHILKNITDKLKSLNLSFNYFMHQITTDRTQHFYIKVQPREGIWGGLELGSGLIINTVSPELAAEYYRNK